MGTLEQSASLQYELHGFHESSDESQRERGTAREGQQESARERQSETERQRPTAPAGDPSSSDDDDEELRALFRAEKEGKRAADVMRETQRDTDKERQAGRDSERARVMPQDERAPAVKASSETLAALDALLDEAGSATATRGSEEDSEESQEEEGSQEDFVYDGVTYLRNAHGEVTNPETDERVGEWDQGEIEWDSEEAKEQHEGHIDFRPAKRRRRTAGSGCTSLRRATFDSDSCDAVPTAAVAADTSSATHLQPAEVIDCDEVWNAMAADEEEKEALKLSLRPAAEVFGTVGSHELANDTARDEELARQIQADWNRGGGQSPAVVDDEMIARRLQEELNRNGAQQNRFDLADTAGAQRAAALPVLQIRFMTYNLWFDESNRAARMGGILDIIQKKNPHIIAFQEMIPEFVALLKPALERIGYRVELQNGGQEPYFVGLAVCAPLKFEYVAFDPFPSSQMGRGLLWGLITGPVGTRPVLAGSVHLESFAGKKNPGTRQRQEQLHRCLASMSSAAERHVVGSAVILGDMNWNDQTDGDMRILLQATEQGSQRITDGWSVRDVWTELHPGEHGWSYDGRANAMLANTLQARFDRAILLSKLSDVGACGKIWTPSSIGLCGKRPLPGLHRRMDSGRMLAVLPSDHFGVLGVLKCAEMSSGVPSTSLVNSAAVLPPRSDSIRLKVRLVINSSEIRPVKRNTEIETQIELQKTVADLKHQICTDAKLTTKHSQLTLIHDGKALNNGHTKLLELKLKHLDQVVAVVAAKPASGGLATGGAGSGGAAAAAVAAPRRSSLQSRRVCWDSRSSHQNVQQFCEANPPSTTTGVPDGWIWLFSEVPRSSATAPANCKPDYETILAPMRDANRGGRSRKKKEKDHAIAQLLQAAKSAGETSGKFILMPHSRHADDVWRLVATSFADGKLGHTAKISSADQGASSGGGSQQANAHVICVYVDIFDVSMVTRCAKELFSLNHRLPSGCPTFSGKIKPDIFTNLLLNAGNDCKLPVTLSAFYSPVLSEECGTLRTLYSRSLEPECSCLL